MVLLDMVVVIENYGRWSDLDWIKPLDRIRIKEWNLSVKETKRRKKRKRKEEKKEKETILLQKNGQ